MPKTQANRQTEYSPEWVGQDGREYRQANYWVGNGYRNFLQVKINGEWRGC